MCLTDLQQDISRALFSHQIERVLFRASFSCICHGLEKSGSFTQSKEFPWRPPSNPSKCDNARIQHVNTMYSKPIDRFTVNAELNLFSPTRSMTNIEDKLYQHLLY